MPLRCLACGLAVAALLPAQARKPAFGVVVDAAGALAAGVDVTCVGTPWFGDAEAPTDLVTLVTDARGRFVARLLPSRAYSVWAATAPQADGRFRCSQVQDTVLAGGQLSLQLTALRRPQRVVLRGGEAWRTMQPLRLEVMPEARSVYRVALPAGSGSAPPLPPLQRVLVLDRQGAVLWQMPVPRGQDGALPLGDVVVELPPPRRIDVSVEDAAGRPIAGAVIDHSPGELRGGECGSWLPQPALYCWRRTGVTGRDGTASLQVPARLAAGGVITGVHLRARAGGYAEVHAGNVVGGRTFVGGQESWTAATAVIPFVLERAPPLAIDGPRVAGDLLLFLTMATGDCILGDSQRLPAAAAALLPTPAQLDRGSLLVALPQQGRGSLYALAAPDGSGHRVDLRARQVRLQVREPSGGPAQGVLAVALPWGRTPPFTPLLPVPLDQAGRGEIALGGGDWLVFAASGDAIGWRSLRAADRDQSWQIDLRAMPTGTVRVLSRVGAPVVGAGFGRARLCMRGDFAWEGECGALATMLQRLQPHLLAGRSSDARGLLRLPLFALPCWSVGATVSVGGVETGFVDLVAGEVVDVFR